MAGGRGKHARGRYDWLLWLDWAGRYMGYGGSTMLVSRVAHCL